MLVGGVVDDQVDDDPHAPLARLQGQLGEVTQVTDPRVDAVVVGHVVTVVAPRRRMDRIEPQTCHTQPGQVIQAADQTRQIAASVTVGVREQVHLDAVDHRFLVPTLGHLAPPPS